MATAVPYTGVPTVAPAVEPLQQAHVEAPNAAFGGAVAGAITHMGEVAQGAGQELFSRAYAMQELNEQAKADAASQDVFEKQTKLFLDLGQLKGQERVAALPKFEQDLRQAREDGMEGIQSPYGKMQYLRDTRRNESMMLFHAGTLVKQGMDEASKEASLGKIDARGNQLATLQVTNGPDWDAGVAGIKRDAANLVHEQFGFPPGTPDNDNLSGKYLSKQVAKVALARSSANPPDGKDFAEKMRDTGLLHPEDWDGIADRIESRVNNKTAADISRQAIADAGPDATPREVVAKAKAAAQKADPGNAILAENATERTLTLKNHATQAEFLSEKQDTTTLLHTIDGLNSKDGKVPISYEDAAAQSPDFDKAFHNLSPESQNVILNQIRRNQEVGGVVHNPTGDLTYHRMMEIGINRDTTSTPKELDDLANADLLKAPYDSLTREQRQNLLKIQGDVIHNQIQNPNMTHALHLPAVEKLLKDAQIDKASNADEYNKFQTTYHDAVTAYGLGAERSVKNDDELTTIATSLINKQAGTWFGGIRGINTKQPYAGITEWNPKAKKIGEQAFYQQFNRSPVPDSETDNQMVDRLALQAIYQKYGMESKSVTSKRTDRVQP